ncbi:MAG: gamma carbonic anhydrase family protein [Candidatus Hydrogenedentota bacterium]|nr:MAG: gamma carbonic anhydrase family protein [Candidatus Hydrogenedentota bacterium]
MKPVIHPSVFVAERAQIWGDVEMSEGSNAWFGAVIRGDEGKVSIGENTNIQDNCVIHSDLGMPVVIGADVSVGHGSVLRACQIGDGTMIGMHSTIMSGVSIGRNCVVGAHSLITYNQKFDDNSLIMGVPAKRVRDATEEEKQFSKIACDVYRRLVIEYKKGKIRGHTGEP